MALWLEVKKTRYVCPREEEMDRNTLFMLFWLFSHGTAGTTVQSVLAKPVYG